MTDRRPLGLPSARSAPESAGVRTSALLLLAAAVVLQGCGGDGSAEEAGRRPLELEGAPLLVGSSLDQWALLGVPRRGGTVEIRSVRDPRQVVQEGSTSVPASVDVRHLGERQVFIRTDDGVVLHYDPEADELTRTGTVGAEPVFSSWNGYGVYVPTDEGVLLEVGERDAWSFEVAGRPVWAAPVEEGRLAVMVEEAENRRSLWLLRRGDAQPESRTAASYSPPGLVTAWGRRLVFRSAGGDGVRLVAVPSLTEGTEIDVGGPITALAASPSSHEIYAALEDPGRVVAVNRFSQEVRELGRIDGSITHLRGSTLGQAVLAYDGGRVWWLPVGGEEPASAAGTWGTDLPLVLPDGRVLLAREGEVLLWNPEAGSGPAPLPEASVDRAWGVVRWNPAPDPVVSDRVRTGTSEEDSVPVAERAAPDSTAEPPEPAPETPEDERGPGAADSTGVPAGFYAVASSAREPDGVRSLLEELDGGGYPTILQRRRDDAGRVWYRALVGPYPARTEAEAAARQLRRERDLAAWVTELGPGVP